MKIKGKSKAEIKEKKVNNKRSKLEVFKVNGKFEFIPFLVNILIPLLGGSLVGFVNKGAMDTYENLIKPPFNPPGFIFPIVWSILYLLMGFAAYRIYMRNKEGANDNGGYFIYLIQLFFNFMWSFLFFTFRLYGLSFIWLLILLGLIIVTFIKFKKVDKLAAYMLIPYMLWVSFAGVLNYFIWMFNEM